MRLSREEQVALGLLTTLGAAGMDCDVCDAKRREFEDKFGVKITGEVIARVIVKVGNLLSGSEAVAVVIGD